jgi:hypothetical protein
VGQQMALKLEKIASSIRPDRYPSIRPSTVREYVANEGVLPS